MADVVLECATLEREGVTVKVYTPDGTPPLSVQRPLPRREQWQDGGLRADWR